MHLVRQSCALLSAAVLTTALLAAAPSAATASAVTASAATAPAATAPATDRGSAHAARASQAQVLLNWERIAFRTVYTDASTPIPVGVPVLGFTSLAMHRAVQASLSRDRASSERAAVVAAAYQVLQRYYPALRGKLGADRAASLASVKAGPAKRFGIKVGKRAARGLLAERAGDGYLDPNIHYTHPAGPGVWQPAAPGGDMLGAWIGSLRHLVVKKHVQVGGPDPITSAAYAAQFAEVKSLGRATLSARTEAQRQTALFFNSNAVSQLGDALIRYLERRPMSLSDTARLFAAIHAAQTDSLIQCWRLKRDVGFWRPTQAIRDAELDGNPLTTEDNAWTALLPVPPYSDYVSGHGCLTSPAVEVIRQTLGERTRLWLTSPGWPRSGLPEAQRLGGRGVPRADLGWAALPDGDGRRLPHRPHHGATRPEGAGLTSPSGVSVRRGPR